MKLFEVFTTKTLSILITGLVFGFGVVACGGDTDEEILNGGKGEPQWTPGVKDFEECASQAGRFGIPPGGTAKMDFGPCGDLSTLSISTRGAVLGSNQYGKKVDLAFRVIDNPDTYSPEMQKEAKKKDRWGAYDVAFSLYVGDKHEVKVEKKQTQSYDWEPLILEQPVWSDNVPIVTFANPDESRHAYVGYVYLRTPLNCTEDDFIGKPDLDDPKDVEKHKRCAEARDLLLKMEKNKSETEPQEQ